MKCLECGKESEDLICENCKNKKIPKVKLITEDEQITVRGVLPSDFYQTTEISTNSDERFCIGVDPNKFLGSGSKVDRKILDLHPIHEVYPKIPIDLDEYILKTDFKGRILKAIGNFDEQNKIFNQVAGECWIELMKQDDYKMAEELWTKILGVVYEIEKKGRIHKGTLYYFWSVTRIKAGDLEKGFILMHQALKEDRLTLEMDWPSTPATFFVTLDYEEKEQFFKSELEYIAEFLEEKLQKYKDERGMSLNIDDLRDKFLKEIEFRDEVLLFVFQIFRLKRILDINPNTLRLNPFSSLIEVNILFTFCLIIENILGKILDSLILIPITFFLKKPNRRYIKHFEKLINRTKILLRETNSLMPKDEIGVINNDFPIKLNELLTSIFRFSNGYTPTRLEEDILIFYGLRNFSAHRIEIQEIIFNNFDEIVQRILNALFFIIEKI
ncbi:MAG: hypothetical protein ACTSRG_22140 [Candidatus Helarchaeota archaeon]